MGLYRETSLVSIHYTQMHHTVSIERFQIPSLWPPLLTCMVVFTILPALQGCFAANDQTADSNLPNIKTFETKPSDRFLVDIGDVGRGHPFLGANAPRPHAGGHVHFDNRQNRWPNAISKPENYPAIYAVADGIVSRIDRKFRVGQNDRYGIDLSFATDQRGDSIRFCYSIEPMIPEPEAGLYEKFLAVREGQKVKKGDVIAYMYTPPNIDSCHIHFHLMVNGRQGFMSPSIFDQEIVLAFHRQCDGFQWINQGRPLPPCMGYQLNDSENPFGTGRIESQ